MDSPDDGGAVDEIEELEDLDDVEFIEESDAVDATAGPAAPTSVQRPPPSPPRPPIAPPVIPPVAPPPAEASADDEGDRAAEPVAPAEPVEAQLEIPTVLEQAIDEARAGDAEIRAARLLDDLDHAVNDKRRTGLLAYELGELHLRDLGDEAAAVKGFDRALRADPTLRPNLWSIRRLIFRRALWPKLIKLLDAEVRIARSDEERADLLCEKAALMADELGDRDGAREAFTRAIALDPACVPALMGLERFALEDGDAATLRRVWRQLAAASANPGRKLSYLLDLIAHYGQPGADDEALSQARQLLVDAVALAPEAGAAERVARERERLAELSGDPVEMLAALEARVAIVRAHYGPQGPPQAPAVQRQPGTPLDRADELRLQIVALRRRQARIARDDSGDPERAWGYLEQALALAGGEPLILADLADLAERLGRYAELAELCQGWESLEGDSTRSLALALRRAEALLRGGQREQAETLLEQLAARAPGYLAITALRERDALTEGNFAALAQVYREAGEAALLGTNFGPGVAAEPDPRGAAAHYVCAAELAASYVGDPEDARGLYERALEAVPGYAPAVEGLGVLFERTGRGTEAAALLELHAETAEGEHRAYLLEWLARLYADLGEVEQHLATLRQLCELAPDNLLHRWRIDSALAEAGRAEERVPELEAIAARTADPAERAQVLLEAARVCELAVGDGARAATLYREVLALDPTDRYARGALLAVARSAGAWSEVVAARESQAAELADGPLLARAMREAAALLRDRLDQPGKAVELYRRLLERVPDDRFAQVELAEALAVAGAWDELIELYEKRADGAADADERRTALLAQGDALERAGRVADATYAYRRASEANPEDPHASIAVVDLAAREGDHSTAVEALSHLAETTDAPALAARLWDEVGWLWALSLGDFDRAAEAFEHALAADASLQSAAIGASLVHARRGETAAGGDALERLAATMHGAYTASALLLRAGAVSEVAGDPEVARGRVAKALATAPDDAGTLVVASEYLPADLGGELPDDHAVEALVQRASLCGMRAAISSDPAARDDWELDQAEALEAAGELAEAGQLVAGVLAGRPDDVRALQLFRVICARAGNREGLARASVALARVLGDREGKLSLLRQAAGIFDREMGDAMSAVPIYRHILIEEPGAPELERCLELHREHDGVRGMLELYGDRLNWLDQREDGNPADAVPLLFERAQLRARVGDHRGAIRDLEALLGRAPEHTGALGALASLRADQGQASEAAELLTRYLANELDPQRRADAELRLSHILAEDMDDVAGAIAQLSRVIEQQPDDIDVRDRLVGLLLKASDWQGAVKEIREIEKRRSSNAERARDELRAAAVLRDRMADASKAKAALERARQLDPLNVDAVRELAELVGERKRGAVLAHAASDVRAAITRDPARPALYERLSVIARWLSDADARYFAVSALGALSTLSSEQKQFVESRRREVFGAGVPSSEVDPEEWRARVVDPRATVGDEIWRAVAEGGSKLYGLEPGKLGVTRSDRVATKSLARDYPAVAALLVAYRADVGEVYISASKDGYARAISGGKGTLVLGSDVARAETASTRFALGRAIALLHQGTGTLAELKLSELAALFAAAAHLAGVTPLPDDLAVLAGDELEERARALAKAMGRRERKSLPLLATKFGELGQLAVFRQAALAAGARAGLLACGDIDAALDVLDVGRGARAITDDPAALELLAWAASDHHIALRKQLGLSQ